MRKKTLLIVLGVIAVLAFVTSVVTSATGGTSTDAVHVMPDGTTMDGSDMPR
jgi:hypothetical protein